MIRSILRQVKEGVRLLIDSSHRRGEFELKELREADRYEPGTTTLLGRPTHYVDSASFLSAYRAIFKEEIYAFKCEKSAPRILDGGANIGLATLYWKRRFPYASVTAFEPDPQIFKALRLNVRERDLEDVELVQKGLWSSNTTLRFNADGADGGHVEAAGSSTGPNEEKKVPVVRLHDYLSSHVDLLKLDIEGAEVEVILDCEGALDTVQRVFVEYHSYLGQEQRLDELLRVLRTSGFRLHIQPELVAQQPFLERPESFGMDNRLNIFAYRE